MSRAVEVHLTLAERSPPLAFCVCSDFRNWELADECDARLLKATDVELAQMMEARTVNPDAPVDLWMTLSRRLGSKPPLGDFSNAGERRIWFDKWESLLEVLGYFANEDDIHSFAERLTVGLVILDNHSQQKVIWSVAETRAVFYDWLNLVLSTEGEAGAQRVLRSRDCSGLTLIGLQVTSYVGPDLLDIILESEVFFERVDEPDLRSCKFFIDLHEKVRIETRLGEDSGVVSNPISFASCMLQELVTRLQR